MYVRPKLTFVSFLCFFCTFPLGASIALKEAYQINQAVKWWPSHSHLSHAPPHGKKSLTAPGRGGPASPAEA